MKPKSFEDWFDKYGSDYLDDLRADGYDDDYLIESMIDSKYEEYVSDFEDRAYEDYKDSLLWED